jgi:hypothetical protein
MHNQCLYPTVIVLNEGQGGSGTGTIVRSEKVGDVYHNVVMTCGHTFLPSDSADYWKYKIGIASYYDWSKVKSYKKYPATVFAFDKELDLGVMLFTSKKKMPVGKINFDKKVYIGNKVFHIGYGLGEEARFDRGEITSLNGYVDKFIKNTLRTNVFTVPGDSGGPLFLDEGESTDYDIIGICQAIRNRRNGWSVETINKISYYIPVSRLKTWQKKINTISFMYEDTTMPVLPFLMMEMETYKPILTPIIEEGSDENIQ